MVAERSPQGFSKISLGAERARKGDFRFSQGSERVCKGFGSAPVGSEAAPMGFEGAPVEDLLFSQGDGGNSGDGATCWKSKPAELQEVGKLGRTNAAGGEAFERNSG